MFATMPRISAFCVGCLALGLLAACTEPTVTGTPQASASAALPAAARYIVEFSSPGAPSDALEAAISKAGGQILRVHTGFGLAIVRGLSPKAATGLRSTPGVKSVVPDFQFALRPTPELRRATGMVARAPQSVHARGNPLSAGYLSLQWNMQVTSADSAWSHSQGSGMHVYVLDSGVDTAHVELVGKIDLTHSTSFAYAATDTLMQNPLPYGHDVVGHGTFVSSVVTSNAVGIAGTAPAATVTMVRILDDSGSGSFSSLLTALLYAADNNADVVNLSIGGYFDRTYSYDFDAATLLELIVQYAVARGTFIAAAAGNESLDFNTATSTTGSYADSLEWPGGTPHVLSVGATGPIFNGSTFVDYDSIASYSNYGSTGVGVFAPGGNGSDAGDLQDSVTSEWIIGACSSATTYCPGVENGYLVGTGTSFASPMAAGEAADIKAGASSLSVSQIEKCILNNADDVTGKRPDPNYNYGRINVLKAVTASGC
jgi:lantibiotic leader peptide-processing serine protease